MLCLESKAFAGDENEFVHVMHNFTGVRNLDDKISLAEVHKVVEVDRDIEVRSDFQDPPRAIVAAIRSVVDIFGHEIHEEQGLRSARQLFRRNNTEDFSVDGIGAHDIAAIDGLDDFLREGVFEPFRRICVVEKHGCAIDDVIHVAVMNG